MADEMKKAGVMGWPVSHSLSPLMHRYWINRYKLNATYEALPVDPRHLAEALSSLGQRGLCGVNLTMPHKEATLVLVHEADAAARAIGAVNLVVVKDGKLHGRNTDAYGFMAAIRQQHPSIRKEKAVVLGAGGAARAVVWALKEEGFTEVVIANRTQEKSRLLAARFRAEAEPWERRADLLEGADLLVNTTTLGMRGQPPLEIELDTLPVQALVCDIVYAPLETGLLKAARKRGNPTVDGLGMLMHQAVPCFEAWFAVRPDVTDDLRRHLVEHVS